MTASTRALGLRADSSFTLIDGNVQTVGGWHPTLGWRAYLNYGLTRGTGRITTIDCPGDLHCGWMNCFFSREKNLEALKMGINIVIYYLSH
jgi:hypothetical protein